MRRWTTVLVAAGLLGGCGGGGGPDEKEHVAQAVRDHTQALNDRDARRLCFKAFASTDLPPRLARQLGVPEGSPGAPTAWDRHNRECVQGRSNPGAFAGIGRLRITIRHVTIGPAVKGADPISRTAAVAAVVTEQGRKSWRYTFRLVDFRGDWKVVFEVN